MHEVILGEGGAPLFLSIMKFRGQQLDSSVDSPT